MNAKRTERATEAAARQLWERDVAAYLDTLTASQKAARERLLRRYVDFVRRAGARTPKSVTTAHVHHFEAALCGEKPGFSRVYAPTTITQFVQAARGLHRFLACERGYPDPFFGWQTARLEAADAVAQRRAPAVLHPDDVACLRQAEFPHTPEGARDAALLHLLCATGARVAELLSLRPFDVDARRHTLRLGVNRGSVLRTLPLDEDARLALRRYLKHRPSLLRADDDIPRRGRPFKEPVPSAAQRQTAPLFVARGGRALAPTHVVLIVARATHEVGLPPWIRPGTVRASLAVHALQDGAPEIVRQQLGARSMAGLERHARVANDQLRRTASLHPRA